MLETLADGLGNALQMAWEVWWALVLGFAFHLLAQHQEIQAKLAKEIDDVLADTEELTAKLTAILTGLFPALDGVEITHTWGGAVAAARDLVASVGLDGRLPAGAPDMEGEGTGGMHPCRRTLRW